MAQTQTEIATKIATALNGYHTGTGTGGGQCWPTASSAAGLPIIVNAG